MGFFGTSPAEAEEIRGVKDENLTKLSDSQLIFIALARLYEGLALEDDALVCEMYRRGGSTAPNEN